MTRTRRRRTRPRTDPWDSYTYGQIARGTRLSTSAVSRIFRRERQPKISTAQRIAAYLGVSLDRFLGALS